jgi:hypothetical protein
MEKERVRLIPPRGWVHLHYAWRLGGLKLGSHGNVSGFLYREVEVEEEVEWVRMRCCC